MMRACTRALVAVALLMAPRGVAAQGPGTAQKGSLGPQARSAMAKERKAIASQARRRTRSLFERLCPGRCELVDLSVEMKDPQVVGGVEPGFEGGADQAFAMEPESISMTVLLDSKLPSNFQQNLPRMIEYQLQNLAPNIEVRRESLAFPKPQNRPSPPPQERRPRRRSQPPPAMPEKEKPEPEPEPEPKQKKKQEPADTKEADEQPGFWAGLWTFLEEIAPWIGPILMMIVLFLLGMALFRRINEMGAGVGAAARDESGSGEGTTATPEAVRAELTESRAVKNRVLRGWLRDDPEGVADLVRLLGPTILDDLKGDDELEEELEEVSEIVARHQDPLSEEETERVVNEALARINSARIRHEDTELAVEWDFLEGIGITTLQRILESCNTREKLHVMGKLPQTLRGSYLESLGSSERRELFLASDSGELDKQNSRALATRLRKAADQYGHVGAEAEGRAALVVDMLESLELDEQEESLRELYDTRPDVAESVLSEICLETATLYVPQSVLADAIHRTQLETLTNFMRGTRGDVRDRLLEVAPRQKGEDLRTELSLDVPVGRTEFLAARDRFMGVVKESIRKEGHDLVEANVRALRESGSASSQQTEVAQ